MRKTFACTHANLLGDVVHAGIGTMALDAVSNRVSFTSSTGGTTQFMYDITAGPPRRTAVIEETGPVYYIREPNGALLARLAGETVNYYHFDALGSTRLLTNSSGAATDTYTYDAWGTLTNHTEHTGSVDQPYQFVGQLGYYTHVQDVNLPLLQLGVRFYDAETGRFTQVDPQGRWGDPRSAYGYVFDQPLMRTDSTGRVPDIIDLGPIDRKSPLGKCIAAAQAQYDREWKECVANWNRCMDWWGWVPYFGASACAAEFARCRGAAECRKSKRVDECVRRYYEGQ